jgi:hypothetical protein
LLEAISNSYLVDVDHFVNGNPRQDEQFGDKHYRHVAATVAMNVAFQHKQFGYEHFIINYVFTKPSDLHMLRSALYKNGFHNIYTFLLWATPQELDERVIKRFASDPDSPDLLLELERHRVHTKELQPYWETMALGEKVETSGKTTVELAIEVSRRLESNRLANTTTMTFANKFVEWTVNGSKTATTRLNSPKYQSRVWSVGAHFYLHSPCCLLTIPFRL